MMNIHENFITSSISPPISPGFKEQTLEKVLSTYERKNVPRWTRIVQWLFGLSLAISLCIMLFIHINTQITTKREMAQIDKDTQSVETEITNDPVLTEVIQGAQ